MQYENRNSFMTNRTATTSHTEQNCTRRRLEGLEERQKGNEANAHRDFPKDCNTGRKQVPGISQIIVIAQRFVHTDQAEYFKKYMLPRSSRNREEPDIGEYKPQEKS